MAKRLTPGGAWSHYATLAGKGFCMGAADVVPGVSGGTMAFILGIYQELLEAVRSFDARFFGRLARLQWHAAWADTRWRFLLALGAGILLAVFTLARGLAWLLHNQPVLIWSFFFGLVLASVVTVARSFASWGWTVWLSLTVATVAAYFLVGMVPVLTPETHWFIFLSGAVAICAMILPGISGSFILVLLGKYLYILEAVNERHVLTLLIFAAGAAAGLASFVRLLHWLFRHYHAVVMGALVGLMLGSLRKVWPWKATLATITDPHGQTVPSLQVNVLPAAWNGEVSLALLLAAAGFGAVMLLDRWAARKGTAA